MRIFCSIGIHKWIYYNDEKQGVVRRFCIRCGEWENIWETGPKSLCL